MAAMMVNCNGSHDDPINGDNTPPDHDMETHPYVRNLLERNQILSDELQALKAEREKWQEQYQQLSLEKLHTLEDENVDLKKKLHRRELVLHDAGYDASGRKLTTVKYIDRECTNLNVEEENGEMGISMMSMDPQPPTVLTRYLETKVEELADENDQLETQNEMLQARIDELQMALLEKEEISEPSNERSPQQETLTEKQKASSNGQESGHDTRPSDDTIPTDEPSSVAVTEREEMLNRRIAELESLLQSAQSENDQLRKAQEETASKLGAIARTAHVPHGDLPAPLQKRSNSLQGHSFEREHRFESLIVDTVAQPSDKPVGKMGRRMSLEDQLLEIDRQSGHSANESIQLSGQARGGILKARKSTDAVHGESKKRKPETVRKFFGKEVPPELFGESLEEQLRSLAKLSSADDETFGHASFLSEANRTQTTGRTSHASKHSATSWGMLSLAQRTPRKSIRSKWSIPTPLETLPQGNDSKDSFGVVHTEAFHDSLQTLTDETDNLEDLYRSAADLFDNEKSPKQTFDGHKSASVFNDKTRRRNKHTTTRRNSDGGASPAIGIKKSSSSRIQKKLSDPLVDTARMLAAEEEIAAIIQDTQTLLETCLSDDLIIALRESAIHSIISTRQHSFDHSTTTLQVLPSVAESIIEYKLIDQAERMYGKPIPAPIVSALRAASVSHIEASRREIEAMELMKQRLEEELLDALIETSERQLHEELPDDVVMSLRCSASNFKSLLQEENDSEGMLVSIHLNFREMDRMFAQAQKILGRPFTAQQIIALRRASFVLQSRLEGADFDISQDSSDATRQLSTISSSQSVSDRHSFVAAASASRFSACASSDSITSPRRSTSAHSLAVSVTQVSSPDNSDHDEKTDESIQIGTVFPSIQSPRSVFSKPGLQGASPINEGGNVGGVIVKSHSSMRSTASLQSKDTQGSRRRRSKTEGGEDPGVMYRVARARSRSPTSTNSGNLDAIYDKAILARTRSSSPESVEDLDLLFRRASLGRTSNHDLSQESLCMDSPEPSIVEADATKGPSSRNGLKMGKQDAPTPPKRHVSLEPEQDVPALKADFAVPLNDSGFFVETTPRQSIARDQQSEKKLPNPKELDSIVRAAKEVLGHDISHDLLDALKLLSEGDSGKSRGRATKNGQSEIDEDNEEIKSADFSRHSEISLNLSAVFKSSQTSELERKLNDLDPPAGNASATLSKVPRHLSASDTRLVFVRNDPRGTFPKIVENPARETSPQRRIRKTMSNNVEELFSGAAKQGRQVRRTRSAEAKGKSAVHSTHTGGKRAVEAGSLSKLSMDSAMDDLEQLYKHAVDKDKGDKSLLASTYHMPNKKGAAAFETIISDTEETYGIEIPSDIVEALKKATMGDKIETPFISIVRSLHTDGVILEAEKYLDSPIPSDLIDAIRSTSLPPGVSVVSLRPLENSISNRGKRFNSSHGSMALSLNLTDSSSRRSYSARTSWRESAMQNSTIRSDPTESGIFSTETPTASLSSHNLSMQEQDFHTSASSNAKPLMDMSMHSDNSWGKLSLSKSPDSSAMRKRGDRKVTKKHRKGTKDAMFERAQRRKDVAADFMNSLAELPTDDLIDLYKQARHSLDQGTTTDNDNRGQSTSKSEPEKTELTVTSNGVQPLKTVLQGDASLASLFSMVEEEAWDGDDQHRTEPSSPQQKESSITLSPQEAELELLFTKFLEITGRPVPFEIEIALRKASRSMDESLDDMAPLRIMSGQIRFGSQLTQEKVELINGEAEVFLGREIDEGILETLMGASNELRKGFRPNSPDGSEGSIISNEGADEKRMSEKSMESLLTVAQGGEDDLNRLYKVAYSQSPRITPTGLQVQQTDFSVPDFSTPSRRPKRKVNVVPRAAPSPKEGTLVPANATRAALSFSGAPVTQVDPTEDDLELTESGRFLVSLSPMTEASMGTMNNSGSVMDLVDSAKAHLRKLSAVPKLDESEAQLRLESEEKDDDDGNETEQPLNDADDSSTEESLCVEADQDGIRTNGSSQTSFELDAIITEAQVEYGMDLPPELVEALKMASAASLTDFESAQDTSVSSLIMQHIDGDDNQDNDGSLRGLVMEVRNKLSKSDDKVSRSIARRWMVEEYFESLIRDAEEELDSELPLELVRLLWQAIATKCEEDERAELSWHELKNILGTWQGDCREFLTDGVMAALEKASQEMQVTFHGQASGYFSAVSENEDVSVLIDEFAEYDTATVDIVEELENLKKELPVASGDTRNTRNIESTEHEESAILDHSTDLVGVKFTGSATLEYSTDLEYSESTFSSLPLGSTHSQAKPPIPRKSSIHNSGHQSTSNDDSLSRIDENRRLTELDVFLAEAAKEYGRPLPEELVFALKQLSVSSGLTMDSEYHSAARRSEVLGLQLSPDVAGALRRAASKSSKSLSKHLSQGRQSSGISALSGFSKQSDGASLSSSSVDLTADEDNEGDEDDDTKTEEGDSVKPEKEATTVEPPPPPPPPPPLLPLDTPSSAGSGSLTSKSSFNKNLGLNLLREVKKVYNKQIPLELSYVLARSKALSSAMNTDEEIQIILEECEDMSGKRLPADLLLALREASVTLRAPSTTSKSRRAKLMRQGSGSFRSTSRSSGMPSIQEWTASTVTDLPSEEKDADAVFEVDRVPSSFGPLEIPTEIAAEERSNMDLSTLKDSQHTEGTFGTSAKGRQQKLPGDIAANDPLKAAMRQSMISAQSSNNYSEHSLGMDAVFGPTPAGVSKKPSSTSNGYNSFALSASGSIRHPNASTNFSPFNASTATMLISNTKALEASKRWLPPPSVATIDDQSEQGEQKSNMVSFRSDSSDPGIPENSDHLGSVVSTGSSTSTEVTANNSTSVGTGHADEVSRASTLPSRRLPIGVNPVPPLEGVETDDLSAIFKEAAKRFN